ncbi:MAG: hypothetical protein LKM31_01960 [Sphingobium sp.]|nr:hypothetical protein [Sphingobium sp.]
MSVISPCASPSSRRRAGIFVVDVDDDGFIGLGARPFRRAEQHARAADAELEAFAAHRLDEHAKLQFAAPGDFEAVLVGAFGDADGDIDSASRIRRSRIMRLVTLCPRGPPSGCRSPQSASTGSADRSAAP